MLFSRPLNRVAGFHEAAFTVTVKSDQTLPPEQDHRVIPFRPRGTPPWRWRHYPTDSDLPDDHLAKYEREESEDDYRHRMVMNLLGLGITVLLIVAGVWLADTIARMRNNQDCFLSGRRNCTIIEAPPTIH
jgi:hypothetical protein